MSCRTHGASLMLGNAAVAQMLQKPALLGITAASMQGEMQALTWHHHGEGSFFREVK